MAAEQKDYGTADDKTLVPGSLTVYRHFHLDLNSRKIRPMGSVLGTVGGGLTYNPLVAEHVAVCGKMQGGQQWHPGSLTWSVDPPVPEHPTPSPDCTCGFYCHYDPRTDFYSGYEWYSNPMLRAVVEVSGTVVMGSRGVRAQKMRIKALSVDLAKWQLRHSYYRYGVGTRGFGFDPYAMDVATHRTETEYHYIGEDVANRYGVRYYGDPEAMYRDHPKPDISALGVEEVLPTEPVSWWSVPPGSVTISTSIADNAVRRAQEILAKAFPQATLGADPDPDDGLTPFERAMKAKRNRPAPPGTGIDRRKRRLDGRKW